MLSQFSSSSAINNPTIYDAVTGISKGNQNLAANAGSYVSAVDNTIFTMIKNDPMSTNLLAGYSASLAQAKAAYAQADTVTKQQLLQQIQMLSNLVNLYTVGTDVSVTNVTQFEAKLAVLAQQNASNATGVSSGATLQAGTTQLSDASQKLAAQFSDGGSFKAGAKQLADGTKQLVASSGKLSDLQNGINTFTDSISQLKDGAFKVYTGAKDLQIGIETAQNGGKDLKAGSEELVDASGKIKAGVADLVNGVAIAGQGDEIQGIMNKLSSNKDEKIADAFDKTFLLASIILVIVSFFGLFTNKSTNKNNKVDEKKRKHLMLKFYNLLRVAEVYAN